MKVEFAIGLVRWLGIREREEPGFAVRELKTFPIKQRLIGPAIGIGHDKRKLILAPGELQKAGDVRQLLRRLAGEAHDEPAHAI